MGNGCIFHHWVMWNCLLESGLSVTNFFFINHFISCGYVSMSWSRTHRGGLQLARCSIRSSHREMGSMGWLELMNSWFVFDSGLTGAEPLKLFVHSLLLCSLWLLSSALVWLRLWCWLWALIILNHHAHPSPYVSDFSTENSWRSRLLSSRIQYWLSESKILYFPS